MLYFVWCVVGMVFYDSFIGVINGGMLNGYYINKSDIAHSILRWGHNISVVAFPMAVFFKSRLFKNICVFFSLPFAIAATACFDKFIWYYTQSGGKGWIVPEPFRKFFLAFELILALVLPLLLVVCDRHYLNVKDKKEVIAFFVALPAVIFSLCPINIPQSLFGDTKIGYSAFSVGNVVWGVLLIAAIATLYHVFRFRCYRDRYMLCVFMAMTAVVGASSLFMMGFDAERLPFHVNNACTFLLLAALVVKKEKFFNFVFLFSIASSVLSIAAASTEGRGIGAFWAYHFFIEQSLVLTIPVVCTLLRIFPRIAGTKTLLHLIVGFAVFYGFSLIVGTVLNGITDITKLPKVNYLFILDTDSISSLIKLPGILTWKITLFGRFTFYPVLQTVIFWLYVAVCSIFYLAIQKLYNFVDDQFELRQARIDLQEKITKKQSNAARDYAD